MSILGSLLNFANYKEKNRTDLEEAKSKLAADKLKKLTQDREQAAKKAELDKIERDKQSKLETNRQDLMAVEKMHERAWNSLMNYGLGKKEVEKCTNDDSGQPVYYHFRELGGSYISMPTIEDILTRVYGC